MRWTIFRFNLVGKTNSRIRNFRLILMADVYSEWKTLYFHEKKILKNHKFFPKIAFFGKKGWFLVEQSRAKRQKPVIIKLQTFLHLNQKRFFPTNSNKKNYGDLKIFHFFLKIWQKFFFTPKWPKLALRY